MSKIFETASSHSFEKIRVQNRTYFLGKELKGEWANILLPLLDKHLIVGAYNLYTKEAIFLSPQEIKNRLFWYCVSSVVVMEQQLESMKKVEPKKVRKLPKPQKASGLLFGQPETNK
jgi:hypothetical protein